MTSCPPILSCTGENALSQTGILDVTSIPRVNLPKGRSGKVNILRSVVFSLFSSFGEEKNMGDHERRWVFVSFPGRIGGNER